MADNYTPLRPGNETSEFKMARTGSIVGIIAMLIGAITSILPGLMEGMAQDGKIFAICGVILAVAGLVTKVMVTLGYQKGRENIKVPLAQASKAQSQAALVMAQKAAIEASKKPNAPAPKPEPDGDSG